MKKQLLLLSSAMLLLTACSPKDPSSGSSSSTPNPTPTSSSVSSEEPVEPAKIDVTIKITATGIDEYSGSHSKLYINSTFDKADGSDDWTTHAMTQDSENENIWTYTFSQIEVDARYSFNIFYGSDEAADWSNGRHSVDGESDPISVAVTEGQTEYAYNLTFNVPTTKHTFTLVLTPHVQTTEGTDDTMYDSTYLWMWCSVAKEAALTKQSDGTWTYQVTDYVGDTFQYTPCLGSQSAINWSYQCGAYENNEWVKYNSGISLTLEEGTTSYSNDVYFNAQPAEVVGETYSVTWRYNATNWDNLGQKVSVVYTLNDGNKTWLEMAWVDGQTSYNETATLGDIPNGATVNYYLY